MKKENRRFCCLWFRAKNIDQSCTSLWKLFDRKLIFLLKEGIHIANLKKQKKYMSSYYFLFYIYIQYEFM